MLLMNSNNIFINALIISLAIHFAIFLKFAGLNLLSPEKKAKGIEITYVTKHKERFERIKKNNASGKKIDEFLKLSNKMITQRMPVPQYEEPSRDIGMLRTKNSFKSIDIEKPAIAKPDIVAIKKKITLQPVEAGKINSPSYINYYQIVREKIRRAAYQNYSRADEGEAYLSFVITRFGLVSEIGLVEEKSTLKSAFLKEVAINSIRDAAPFPSFPKELDYPQLSFNIIISFEIE